MSEKDNIKLKTDTLSSRKSSASAGVHVKRKRKIIAKPVSKEPARTKNIARHNSIFYLSNSQTEHIFT